MALERSWIEACIPHQGRMCLLDQVIAWDAERIRCRSGRHRDADNPLRAHGRLGAACGIEFAAQAMALHGVLLEPASAGVEPHSGGVLASVREVEVHVPRLDAIAGDLLVEAERLAGDRNNSLYRFSLWDGERLLLGGRATVVLNAGPVMRGS